MSHKFDTWDDVDAYAAEHGGVEPLRMMLAQGTLEGKRKQVVEHYLRNFDAATVASKREAQASEALELSERSAIASEASADAAGRSADATDRAAKAAERSARYAMYTAVIALVAIIVTVVSEFYFGHGK